MDRRERIGIVENNNINISHRYVSCVTISFSLYKIILYTMGGIKIFLLVLLTISLCAASCVHQLDFMDRHSCLNSTSDQTYAYPVATKTIRNSRISSGFGGFVDYAHSHIYDPTACNGENLSLSPSCNPGVTIRSSIQGGQKLGANDAVKLLALVAQTMFNLENGIVLTTAEETSIVSAFSNFPYLREMTYICSEASTTVKDPIIYQDAISILTSINSPETREVCIESIPCTSSHDCSLVTQSTSLAPICYTNMT